MTAILTVSAALGATATASEAYIHIPGSINGNYGGLALSDEVQAIAANQDITSSTVRASGQRFLIEVNTYATAAGTLGFNLVYNQVPCNAVAPS